MKEQNILSNTGGPMLAKSRAQIAISLIFILFFSLGLAEKSNSPQQINKPVVIMISIDGFRNDYLTKYKPPTLVKLANEGTSAQGIIPSFPSLTFPNHVTLVTGMAPGHHGIVSNFFYDKKRKAAYQMTDGNATNDGTWYRGEPLWAVAEKSGMLAATCFWVGSEATIGGIDPTYVRPYDGKVTNEARVDQVIDWLKYPDSVRPHFVSLYFSDVDSMGHKFGPDSAEIQKALAEIDSAIGRLVQWTDQSVLNVQYIVVSDHGMLPIKEKIDISSFADFTGFTSMERGATTLLYTEDSSKIEPVYQSLKKNQKNFRVFKPSELPPKWKYTDTDRIGDLILVADPGFYLIRKEGFTDAPTTTSAATHGWDPETTEQMKGLFIARGSMIKSGFMIEAFKNTDVYPLVLNILGLKSAVANDSNPQTLMPVLKEGVMN